MLSIFLVFYLRLSEFCSSPSQYKSPIQVDDFDIPFESCSVYEFNNIEIRTTYSAIKNYKYRTLRLDNQLKFTINDVTSGDILTKLDIADSVVTLNVHPNTPSSTIEGDIRINKINGAHLIINNGSFRVNPQKLIRFIHTNDIHCAYIEDPDSNTIGLPKFVSYVKKQKKIAKENGYSVFAVDCGDFNQGLPLCNVFNGSVGHEALKIAPYDAFTLGNHEWDWGHHNMYVQYQDFVNHKSPLIVSNVIDQSKDEKIELTPYLVKEINSFGSDSDTSDDNLKLRVGIFGILTPYTNVTTNPLEVKDVTFLPDIVSISQKYVKILREDEKCDIVVLICHLGYESLELTSNKIGESFDGIDVIIDGHSHTTLENGATRLNNDYTTLIAQTGSSLKNIGVVDIVVDSITKKVVGKKANLLDYNQVSALNLEDDAEMSSFLNEKQKEIEKLTNVVVGNTLIDLDCERSLIRVNGQSKMAYLASSGILNKAVEADFSIVNGGGIRSPIKKGQITWGNVVSVLPFGNQVVVLQVTGKQIHYLLRYGTRLYNQEEYGGFPIASGISYTINLDKNWEDENRITDLKIVGIDGKKSEPIVNDDNHFYKLATTDFLYSGGDGYESIVGVPRLNQYSTELNAVLEYIGSLPDSTITGEEDIFKYTRIKETGGAPILRKYGNYRKGTSSTFAFENTVEINSGFLNLLDSKINVPDFTPIFNFTAKANTILAPDVDSINKLLDSSSSNLGFAGKNGVFIAGNQNELLIGNSMNDQARPIGATQISSCSFFSKLDDDGKCKLDAAVITIFALMCAYIVIIIILIVALVIIVKNNRNSYKQDQEEADDNKKNPLLNAENI